MKIDQYCLLRTDQRRDLIHLAADIITPQHQQSGHHIADHKLEIFELFIYEVRVLLNEHRTHFGARCIGEYLRYQTRANDHDPDYKLNNND